MLRIKLPFCLSTHSLHLPDFFTPLEIPSNPYIFFDEIYSYRIQDALIEFTPNTYLANIIASYLFLKNRYWAGGGLGQGVENKPGNQEI